MAQQKDQWGTRLGMILAVAGSAVGLGNFLRFPGTAAANGGGGFMIAYFCALIFLGTPICWAEWAMGKHGGQFGFNSSPAIFGLLGRRSIWRYLGVLGLIIPVIIYMYYVLIESWCLGYAVSFLVGWIDLGNDPAQYATQSVDYFNAFVGANENGLMLDGRVHISVVVWLIVFAVNFYFIFRGLSKGIETFCTWAMPLMALCAIAVLIRVLTLGAPDPARPELNVVNGLGYMWNPKPLDSDHTWISALAQPKVWMAAAGQIFFSLSVGFGVIINYASYLKRKDDIVLSGLTASATTEVFEVGFGGLITITASFVFLGTANMIGAVQGGTFGLGFTTLPVVFAHMGWIGNFIGAVFFFMLFLAAITSSISRFQPSLAFFQESLGWSRKAAPTLMVSVCIAGSFLVMYFSEGGLFWSTIDDWVGTFLIFVLAMVQIILFSWVFGIDKGFEEAHHGAHVRIPGFYRFIMKYVTPTYLLVIFAFFC